MIPEGKPGERRYGSWAGEPKGTKENITRCIESVYNVGFRSTIPHQCARKRGFGPNGEFCKQHAKKLGVS